MICCTNLTYTFKEQISPFELGPVSVTIPAGKVVFWVGHIGSGKSTLARLLCGELPPDSGSVEGLKGTSIYHHQTVVDNIFPDLSVADHMRLLGHDINTKKLLVDGLLPEISSLLNKYPDELSGGQLQLVAFTTVILENHTLYVFDEVFNNLDHIHADRVMNAIRRILSENDHAHCIIITHDLELVRKTADLVHVFFEGRITQTLDRHLLSSDKDQLINLLFNPKAVSQ